MLGMKCSKLALNVCHLYEYRINIVLFYSMFQLSSPAGVTTPGSPVSPTSTSSPRQSRSGRRRRGVSCSGDPASSSSPASEHRTATSSSSSSSGCGMGNLLRVLYSRDDSPAKIDIFVDFESKWQSITWGTCLSIMSYLLCVYLGSAMNLGYNFVGKNNIEKLCFESHFQPNPMSFLKKRKILCLIHEIENSNSKVLSR